MEATFASMPIDVIDGLYCFSARFYDPATGRFITEDTKRGNGSDPMSLNRYAYGRDNPMRYTDPTGHVYISDNGYYYTPSAPATPPTTVTVVQPSQAPSRSPDATLSSQGDNQYSPPPTTSICTTNCVSWSTDTQGNLPTGGGQPQTQETNANSYSNRQTSGPDLNPNGPLGGITVLIVGTILTTAAAILAPAFVGPLADGTADTFLYLHDHPSDATGQGAWSAFTHGIASGACNEGNCVFPWGM